jgi:predicted TIM-barrel fold metal-dependent hydrolase
MHVFGPPDLFPIAGSSNYALPPARAEAHLALLDLLGLEHAVLIQPTAYQTDHGALIDALERAGGRLRAVGVVDSSVDDAILDRLVDAGVRALRFVEMQDPFVGGRYRGTQGVDTLARLAPRMRERGLHAHLWANLADCVRLVGELEPLGLPLVLDHLAGIEPGVGPGNADFDTLVAAVAAGRVTVKLTPYRYSKTPADYADMRPAIDALVAANPQQLLWGSDWPYVRMEGRQPDLGRLIDLLATWLAPDDLRTILVANPARLFGFDS